MVIKKKKETNRDLWVYKWFVSHEERKQTFVFFMWEILRSGNSSHATVTYPFVFESCCLLYFCNPCYAFELFLVLDGRRVLLFWLKSLSSDLFIGWWGMSVSIGSQREFSFLNQQWDFTLPCNAELLIVTTRLYSRSFCIWMLL